MSVSSPQLRNRSASGKNAAKKVISPQSAKRDHEDESGTIYSKGTFVAFIDSGDSLEKFKLAEVGYLTFNAL